MAWNPKSGQLTVTDDVMTMDKMMKALSDAKIDDLTKPRAPWSDLPLMPHSEPLSYDRDPFWSDTMPVDDHATDVMKYQLKWQHGMIVMKPDHLVKMISPETSPAKAELLARKAAAITKAVEKGMTDAMFGANRTAIEPLPEPRNPDEDLPLYGAM